MAQPQTVPDVSIIVVNWNTRTLLAGCLGSIAQSNDDLDVEVFVVDNGSTDGSREMVRQEFPDVNLITSTENLGFARANNRAIRVSHGRYALLLNSDTVVQPGALQAMVHFADQHPEAGVIGCRLLNADGSLQPSWAQFPTLWSELIGRNFRKRRPVIEDLAYRVDWVGGACLLARRKAIEMVGLLDEDFFMYSEEADWCFRMAKRGWAVYYFSGAEVIHFGGGSSRRAGDEMLVQLYRSKLLFFRKHYGPYCEGLLCALLIVVSFLKGCGLRVLSLLRTANGSDERAYRQHLMLSRKLLRGQFVDAEH